MRFLSFEANGQAGIGWVKDIQATDFVNLTLAAPELPRNLKDLICTPGGLAAADAAARKAPASSVQAMASVTMLPLIPNPGKIVCMGLNYADHAKEGGNARPEYPSFFLRGNSSMVGHNQAIVRPKASTQLDYEAELAVIIGKQARHLTAENALDCIAGYSCFNDGSIRNYQRKSSQWTIGKNFDGTGPFGPCLVTPDELPPGAAGLRIQSRLNGKVMQDANTDVFLWNVVEALRIITECMTLEPGDVIITGTPAGVGYARTPPVWMAPGDICEIEVEGVGILSNPIVDES
ncbi:MAG: fumarylacetoacetate hydrolase family protein [Burkholderiales bacterium]|jgi:2-keto-4-pentenoate hydratase/2-oxohepta-3-ene-1,7-dioic acid hydratase in catechol pathway|nr:fumarylacetoacetate hydrolase family protein [Burkholderiales bacterium]